MRLFSLASISLAIAAMLFPASAGSEPHQNAPTRRTEIGLRSIPINYVSSTVVSEMRYQFAFQNETGMKFRYMQGAGGAKTAANLRFLISRDGMFIHLRGTPAPVPFVKSRVQSMKPNEALEYELILADYHQLKPGRYEVRAKYDMAKTHIGVTEFGLTPLEFERTVMILHVEE